MLFLCSVMAEEFSISCRISLFTQKKISYDARADDDHVGVYKSKINGTEQVSILTLGKLSFMLKQNCVRGCKLSINRYFVNQKQTGKQSVIAGQRHKSFDGTRRDVTLCKAVVKPSVFVTLPFSSQETALFQVTEHQETRPLGWFNTRNTRFLDLPSNLTNSIG